eukprot:922962-Pyramimonas_sp.AAC.1
MLEPGWQMGEAISWTIPEPHPAAGDDWRFNDDTFTGLRAINNFKEFLREFRDVLSLRQWHRAASRFCGGGWEKGAGFVMTMVAVGASRPRERKCDEIP